MNLRRAFSAFSRSQRLGSLLGAFAVVSALLSVGPPVISAARELFSLRYLQHEVIRAIRDTFYASLVLGIFAWLHFAWTRAVLRWAARAMTAIVCLAYYSFRPLAGFVRLSLAAMVLTELRMLLTPLADVGVRGREST